MASEVKFIGLLYVFFFGMFPLGALVFSACDEGRKILPWARLLILGWGSTGLSILFRTSGPEIRGNPLAFRG